jgi:hypothetical protein
MDLRWNVLRTTELVVETEAERQAWQSRTPGLGLGLSSCDSLDGVRRDKAANRSLMLRSPRTLLLPLLPLLAELSMACCWNFLVWGLRRGILLGVFGFGGSFGSGEGEGAASAKDASDPGCDTQSSDRESNQACPMVARGGVDRWVDIDVCLSLRRGTVSGRHESVGSRVLGLGLEAWELLFTAGGRYFWRGRVVQGSVAELFKPAVVVWKVGFEVEFALRKMR